MSKRINLIPGVSVSDSDVPFPGLPIKVPAWSETNADTEALESDWPEAEKEKQ